MTPNTDALVSVERLRERLEAWRLKDGYVPAYIAGSNAMLDQALREIDKASTPSLQTGGEGAFPQQIGRVSLGKRRSDGERLCSHSHEVPAGHPLYWPERMGEYPDDMDPLCLEHAIEQAVLDNGWCGKCFSDAVSLTGHRLLSDEAFAEVVPLLLYWMESDCEQDARGCWEECITAVLKAGLTPPGGAVLTEDTESTPTLSLKEIVRLKAELTTPSAHAMNADEAAELAIAAECIGKRDWHGAYVAMRLAYYACINAVLTPSGVEGETVQTTVRQTDPVVADYGDNFLIAHVSKDGSLVGIDHPCDAVWSDVMTAHVALRDRINERIAAQDGCPFKPSTTGETVPADEVAERQRKRLIADLDRHATALYHDMAQSNLWSALIAARDALTASPKQAPVDQGEVERLREAARAAHDTLIELNPKNYTHDDVCEANDAAVEVILLLADVLGETHGKSREWWEARRASLSASSPSSEQGRG